MGSGIDMQIAVQSGSTMRRICHGIGVKPDHLHRQPMQMLRQPLQLQRMVPVVLRRTH